MHRKYISLIILVCLSAIFLIGGPLFLRSAYVLNWTRLELQSQLQERLNRPVTINQISGNVLTGLNIKGIQIADSNPEDSPLISLDEIQIRYRLWNLVQKRILIPRLYCNRPKINARMDPDGALNLAKLISTDKPESEVRFPAQLLISDITIEDITVENGLIHFEDETGALRVTIGGIYSDGRVEGPLTNWKYSSDLEVRDGRFQLNGVETVIDEFKTKFEVQRDRGVLQSLQLELGNSKLIIAGEANNLDRESPQVETQVQATLDIHDVQKILSLPGEIKGVAAVHGEASGPVSEIIGKLELNLPSIQLNALQFENLVVQTEITPSSIKIAKIEALFASGRLMGGAEINIQPKQTDSQRLTYKGGLQFDSLRTEQLLPIIDFPRDFLDVAADLDGEIQFSGNGSDLFDIVVDGDLRLDDAALNGVPIQPSRAHYQLNNGRMSVTANLDDAQIEFDGNAGLTGEHNMDLHITKINIGKLAKILQIPDLAGEGTLTGKSSIAADNNGRYSLRAQLSVPEATLYDVPIGVLTTNFNYTENQVFLHSIRLTKGESRLIANGAAHIDGDIPIELTVQAQPLHIADYVRLAGDDYPIEGIATGELVLDGTLAQLNGRGALQIENGKAWELAMDPLTLPIEVENYIVKIPDFEVLTRGQKGILNAQIDPNQDYIVDFQSESMKLSEIALARGMTDFLLDADLVVTAQGKANAADPLVDVTFEFSNVTYADHPLEDVYITGTYSNNALNFEGVGFNDTCNIRGVLESVEGSPYHVTVDGAGVVLLPFLRIFNAADYLTGTADGNITITGALEDLSKFTFQMSLSETELDVKGRQLVNSAPIHVSFADNLWHIQSLVIADKRDGSPFLNAVGTFPAESGIKTAPHIGSATDTLSFTVEADGFPFEGVSYLLGLPPIFSGNISYKLIGSGTYEMPELALDWRIPNLTVETPIGPITISNAEGSLAYHDGDFTINSFNLLLLDNPVKIDGNIQVDLNRLQDSQLKLHAICPNFELDSRDFQRLPNYLNEFLILSILEAQVTGTLTQPELTVSIQATQKAMQLLDFPQPIENLKVILQIYAGQQASSDLITVELRLADWQFAGGQYRASGTWRLPKTEPGLSLTSVIDVLEQDDLALLDLQVDGLCVNLVALLNHIMKREVIDIESRADISLELQGRGYQPDQVSAILRCNNLRIQINNRDMQNINEIRIDFVDRKLRLLPVQIGEGNIAWLNAAGTIDLSGNMDLHLGINRFPYGVLIPAITLTLFGQSFLDFEGFLTSQIHVGGDFENPIITAQWQSDGHVGNANLRDSGGASYQDKLLSLQNTQRIVGVSKQLEVSGTIPLNLAFQPLDFKDRFLDLPIDLRLQGEQISLTPLALLFYPLIEEADGIADIDLRIQGTTTSPYPRGTILFQKGTLKLANLDTPISNGSIELWADKGEIRIPTLNFWIGQGEYRAEISCTLDGLVATDFEINQFKAHKVRIADFIGDRSRLLNPVVSRFLAPEAMGPEALSAGALNGYITAEANLKIPVNQFLIPGETAWIPKLIKPFNPPNVIKYVTGRLNIQNILIEGLGYKIGNPRPIEIQLTEQKLTLENGFSLEDQEPELAEAKRLRVTGFGSWELGEKLLFHAEMKNLDLGFISGFLPEAYAVRGFLNASLDIRGTDAEPKVLFTWETPELWVNQAEINQFAGNIAYEDRTIRVAGNQNHDAHITIGRNHAALAVLIPFHLSFLEFKAEPLPEDIEGGLDITIGDLDFLSLIFPQFAFTEGAGDINVTLGGRLDSPALKGSADLRNLAFELPNSHINLENGTARLDLTEKGVNIQRIMGNMNNGTFEISGVIQSNWLDVQHIDVVADLSEGTTFEKPGFYQLECQQVSLQMKGAITTDPNLNLPPLTGSIRINEGRYQQHWQQLIQDLVDKTAEVQFEVWFDYPIVRDLQLNLDIIAPNNLWMESDLAEIFATLGEIRIETSINGKLVGAIQKPIFSGRVDLLEGELSLSGGHQFEIQEGSYVENTNTLEFNPWYEITAETVEPIRSVAVPTSDGETQTKDVRIVVRLNGYVKEKHNPVFEADVLRKGAGEDYNLTQSQILSILTLGGANPLASDTSTPAVVLQQYLGNRFAKAVGFSETRLNVSPDNFEESRFLVTKEFLPLNLSLTYSSTFQLHTEPRIEVEYQLNRHFYIKGERNEHGKYGLDLKLERRF